MNLIDKYAEEIWEELLREDYGLTQKELKSKLKQFAEELIGTNDEIKPIEDFFSEFETATKNCNNSGKNNLRAEQRQKAGIK